MSAITPSVLMSRLMSFVLAAAIATALALVFAVSNMFPLNKTQVFILNTRRPESQVIEIKDLKISDKTLGEYKESFIKEYIRARNEVVPNVNAMRTKWSTNGSVYAWSARDVFADFTKTQLWSAFMKDAPEVELSCPVEFQRIEPRGADTYAVRFRWFCTSESAGQTTAKDYTIVVSLTRAPQIRFGARMENPLGLQVSGYRIEEGGGDPLNPLDFAG
jgi:type IV secretory pathway component VirB8